MIEPVRQLKNIYLEHQRGHAGETLQHFRILGDYLLSRQCTFSGKPMPTLLKPNFVSERQTRLLSHAVERISRALNKFIQLYMEDEKVRRIMNFSARERELFSIDPVYSKPLVISRLDAFLNDYSLSFLEFNCDSPAGIAYGDVQESGFRELFKQYPFLAGWKIDYFRRQERLLNALLKCYAEFRKEKARMPGKPVIAIVDWEGVSTSSEFVLHEQYFGQKGYETVICSPHEFSMKHGRVSVRDREVHLIYRRVITRELIQRWDQVSGFLECLGSGRVCFCNPFRSFIVGSKKVLSLITDPVFQYIFSKEELKVIRETVPWTKILADTMVEYRGQGASLKALVTDRKDEFVLKPANSYGGKDVYIGMDTRQDVWEGIINRHLSGESWVVQQYVEVPLDTYPEAGNTLSFKKKYVNINPYALLEKYSGTITRVSGSKIINVSAGGGLVPTLTVRKREKLQDGYTGLLTG